MLEQIRIALFAKMRAVRVRECTTACTRVVTGLVLCAAVVALQPQGAAAQKTELSYDGNGGGRSFNDLCGPDQVVIGIDTKFSELFQRVALAYAICKGVDGQGHWVGPDTGSPTMSFMFDGPTTFKAVRCGQNKAVEYLIVQSVNEVLSMVVFCKTLAPNGSLTGSREEAGRVPRTFYPGFFAPPLTPSTEYSRYIPRRDLICPNSLPARALYGMSGMYVDRIGLRCEAPLTAAKVEFQKPLVRSGEGNVGWLTLNRPNPSTLPIMISLSSNVAGVTVPATVPLMPNANTVLFTFTTPTVSSNTVVTITGKTPNSKGSGASGGFVIQP
jgi:hypothetical protein